jgi:uncharacterized membrane protein YdjX (TVP38/TMEM64 family)
VGAAGDANSGGKRCKSVDNDQPVGAMATSDVSPDPGVGRPTAVSGRVRFASLLVLLVALAVSASVGVFPDLGTMAGNPVDAGPLAAVAAVATTSLLVSVMVPRSVVAAAAGLLYGAPLGAAYVMAGAVVGAMFSFEVGRRLGRDFVRERRRIAAVDRFLSRRGMVGVLALRLLPIAPFGLVSYGFGTTAVRRVPFMFATVVGIAPSTVIFATLGANAMRPTSPAFIASMIAAVVFAVAGVASVRMLSRRSERTTTAT